MMLHTEDLALLYGPTLFVLPDAPAATSAVAEPAAAYTPTQNTTPGITWANATGTRLSIILHETPDAAGDDLLQKIQHALGLPTTAVSSLVLATGLVADALATAPAPYVIGFGVALPAHASKHTYSLASLAQMQADVALKRAAWDAMKQFKDKL